MRQKTAFVLILVAMFLVVLGATACSPMAPAMIETTAVVAQARPAEVVVEVGGTSGVRFEGWAGQIGGSRPLVGSVPARFTLEAREAVVVTLQKVDEEGELTLRLLVNGQQVAAQSTSRPFGLLTTTRRF